MSDYLIFDKTDAIYTPPKTIVTSQMPEFIPPTPAPMVGAKSVAGKPRSDQAGDNILWKLAACPSKREKCGNTVINLASHRSQPVDLKIQNFTEKDSCTWMIKAECGLPTITVSDITENVEDNFSVMFIEYEVDSTDDTKVDKDGYPTNDYKETLMEYKSPSPWA